MYSSLLLTINFQIYQIVSHALINRNEMTNSILPNHNKCGLSKYYSYKNINIT